VSLPAASRGPITLGVMIATFISALDTTVVNVALPHMQGSLSASPEQITWIVTSYIVATAVIMPLSGWFAARVGIKRMLLICVGGFTLASMLCGAAATLPEMVLCRILQGVLAAPLWPLSQAVLLNVNPPERFGRAMALFTMATVAAPVVGPIIGGYLTDNLSWRWCFYINLPTGFVAMLLLWVFLPADKTEPRRFDFLGFASLAVAVACFQLMLDRGPTQDWFQSREIWAWAIFAVAGIWVYLTHTMTAQHPLFDPELARDRNFVTSTIFYIIFSMLMYCSFVVLPLMMQDLMGYTVTYSGVISTPRGLIIILLMQLMGRIDGFIDRRLTVAIGLGFIVAAFWRMSLFDLSMTGRDIVWATSLQGIGQGIVFVPVATLGFATLRPGLRPDASAVSSLLRNLGGSVGVAAMQALTAHNGQTMHASLAAYIRPDDPVLRASLPAYLSPGAADGALALNAELTRQALMVAYVDDFRLMAFGALLTVPLLLFMRAPRKTETVLAASAEAHA
jgi:DHA2 family multidrug resistance protein